MNNEKTIFLDDKLIETLYWRMCRFFDVANMDHDDCYMVNQSFFYVRNIVFTINNMHKIYIHSYIVLQEKTLS